MTDHAKAGDVTKPNHKWWPHQRSRSLEYQAWIKMKKRCADATDPGYKNYGGRGIKICRRWQDFECFLEDMGKKPSLGHSLERIDNDGNYEPNNCKWATKAEQNRNQRKTTRVKWGGETVTLRELHKMVCPEMPYNTLKCRIYRGWPANRAVLP